MKKRSMSVITLVLTSALFADSSAIKELNYSIGASTSYTDMDEYRVSAKGYGVVASANIPLYKYVASNLFVRYNRSNIEYDFDSEYNEDSDHYGSGASLFIRDSSIGKIGASFYYQKTYGTRDYSNNSTSIFADYYLDNFTLGASVSRRETDGKKNEETPYEIGASWYAQDNLRLDFLYYNSDDNYLSKHFYTANLSYQPSFFNNTVEMMLSYTTQSKYKSYFASLNYHFSTTTLKSRDREYR